MAKKARVLLATNIDGVEYKADQVVEFPDAIAKAYAEAGAIDTHKDAVNYALSQGAEVVVHNAAIDAEVVQEGQAA